MPRNRGKNNPVDKRLKPAEILFCNLYAGDSPVFNNGTQAYALAFKKFIPENNPEAKKKVLAVCRSAASALLAKPNILAKCQEVLSSLCNDAFVDREMTFTLAQRKDLSSKMRAVEVYNKVNNRITDQVKHSGEIKMTWEE